MTDQGTTYAAFVDEQLKQEQERRDKLDGRSIALVTTSAGFLTLLAGASILITGKDFRITHQISIWLVIAGLAALALSGLLSVWANRVKSYEVPTAESISRMLGPSHWKDSEPTARSVVAQVKARLIGSLRQTNDSKASELQKASIFQVFGLFCIGIVLVAESLLYK